MSWQNPITNRTQADVDRAKALNDTIAKNGFSSLSAPDKAEWIAGLKGAINAIDLNRIEGNTKYIRDMLAGYGYNITALTYKEWTSSSIPFGTDMERIRANIETLLGWHGSTEIPSELNLPTFTDINKLEIALQEIKDIISLMEQSFIYCGQVNSGQNIL